MSGGFCHVYDHWMTSPAHWASPSCCLMSEVNKLWGSCVSYVCRSNELTWSHMHAQIILNSHQMITSALTVLRWLLYALMLITFPLSCCAGPRLSAGFDRLHFNVHVFKKWTSFFLLFCFVFSVICWYLDSGNYCCFIIASPEPQRRSHHRSELSQ